MRYSIGVDIGGTHVYSILLDEKGKIKNKSKFPIKARERDKVVETIKESIYSVISGIEKENIRSIGLGVPGVLPKNKDKILLLPHFPNCKNLRLKKILKKEFNLDVFIENDGNCAALAEFENRHKYNDLVALTLGTGIGCGIIIDRELYNGKGNAGEFSHITLTTNGMKCDCGNYGCLEEYVSSRGIIKIANKLGINETNVENIGKMAKNGDKAARKVFKIVGTYLGIGLSDLVKILDPEIIILGGGISNVGSLISKPAIKEMKKRTFFKTPKVLLSKLKEDAVAIGAASLFSQ